MLTSQTLSPWFMQTSFNLLLFVVVCRLHDNLRVTPVNTVYNPKLWLNRTAMHFVLQSRAAVEFLPFLPCRPLSLLFLSTALPSSLMILLIFSHTNVVSHTHPHLKNTFAQANMRSAHTCSNAGCRVYRALNAKHSFKIWLWCLPSGLLV